MARRLALELTSGEARALVAAATESRITIERSLSIPLAAEEEPADQAAVVKTIVDALTAAGITRLETIAVVGRADVELRLLTVPPTPDEELPNLVRFQASRELPNLDADLALDYLPLGEAAGQSRRVLAAVLKPGVRQRLEAICEGAKLALAHIVLRSAASVSLVFRGKPELAGKCCLLVEILGRQVELAAVNQGQVVFLRHMLLAADPTDSAEAADSLFGEIRRTRVVAASQESVETVSPIILVGQSRQRRELAERMQAAVDAPVLPVDPMAGVNVTGAAAGLAPQDSDRATALVGALADEAASRPHAFDFLHPRQPPKPPSRRNTCVLGGLAAVLVLTAVVGARWIQVELLRKQIRGQQQKSATLEAEVQKGEKVIAASEKVEDWLKSEVVWLDELQWLSEKFPPSAEDARLTKLTAASDGRRREFTLAGLARNSESLAGLNGRLRDATHKVVVRKSEDRSDERYKIEFNSSALITLPK